MLKKDHIILGLVLGFIVPFVMYALFLSLKDNTPIRLSNEFTDIVCIGSNLPAFYFYLNRFRYRTVQGLVITSIILAIVYIVKFVNL